ncbi:DUF6233 domain-containing protein [Streptomyces sp. NPDC006283]|uniref:DUF6233 domain-containing protein n=1 Tax=Streptomyces sp. NPDC006283 TaxID=3156741 RepID=UPI0033A8583C
MSENVSRLERLRSVRAWLAWQLRRVDEDIAVEERAAAQAHRAAEHRARMAAEPSWCLSYDIGAQRRPIEVHVGGCGMAKRTKTVSREQALEAITTGGVEACAFCRPDTELGVLG